MGSESLKLYSERGLMLLLGLISCLKMDIFFILYQFVVQKTKKLEKRNSCIKFFDLHKKLGDAG